MAAIALLPSSARFSLPVHTTTFIFYSLFRPFLTTCFYRGVYDLETFDPDSVPGHKFNIRLTGFGGTSDEWVQARVLVGV